MAEAVEELAKEGYVRDRDLELFIAQRQAELDAQHEQWKAEGRAEVLDQLKAAQAEARRAEKKAQAEARKAAQAEARRAEKKAQAEARKALISIAKTVAPEAVEELQGIQDFGALRDAVQAIVASLRAG